MSHCWAPECQLCLVSSEFLVHCMNSVRCCPERSPCLARLLVRTTQLLYACHQCSHNAGTHALRTGGTQYCWDDCHNLTPSATPTFLPASIAFGLSDVGLVPSEQWHTDCSCAACTSEGSCHRTAATMETSPDGLSEQLAPAEHWMHASTAPHKELINHGHKASIQDCWLLTLMSAFNVCNSSSHYSRPTSLLNKHREAYIKIYLGVQI